MEYLPPGMTAQRTSQPAHQHDGSVCLVRLHWSGIATPASGSRLTAVGAMRPKTTSFRRALHGSPFASVAPWPPGSVDEFELPAVLGLPGQEPWVG